MMLEIRLGSIYLSKIRYRTLFLTLFIVLSIVSVGITYRHEGRISTDEKILRIKGLGEIEQVSEEYYFKTKWIPVIHAITYSLLISATITLSILRIRQDEKIKWLKEKWRS